MNIQFRTNNTFTAKIGPNLLKQISNEFNDNQKKIDKFINIFDSAHSNTLDTDTVVDVDSRNHYVLSHLSFPNISCNLKEKVSDSDRLLSDKLINECPKVFGWGEVLLFQDITRESVDKVRFDDLEEIVKNNVKTPKNQNKFLEVIDCAKRLLKRNPDSKLSDSDFEIMANEILQEKINTPGTYEHDLIRHLQSLV